MNPHLPWICAVVGFAVSWVVIRLILQRRIFLRAGLPPRQFHQTHGDPVPRFGGVAFAAALLAVAGLALAVSPAEGAGGHPVWVIMASALAMFVLGFIDDLRPVGARWKFAAQILIAAGVVAAGISIDRFRNPFTDTVYELGLWGIPLTIFWLVALTNLINLVDGLDGLAGGIGLMLMCLLAFVALRVGVTFTTLLALGTAGALLAFLFYNFPPAKIYMGDGGAYLIGFLIGLFGLLNSHKGTVAVALIAPVIALALPIFDVGLAILRRGVRGLPIFRADKKHLHHRLMQMGFSPTRAVLTLYGMSLLFLLLGFLSFWEGTELRPLLVGFLLVMLVVTVRWLVVIHYRIGLQQIVEKPLQVRRAARYALAHSRWLELEAERCPTLDALWEDLTFVARKLRFAEMRLALADGEKVWRAEDAPERAELDLEERHELFLEQPMTLEFRARSGAMPAKVFFLLAELTSEAWLNAARRWQLVHKAPIQFSGLRARPAEPAPDPLVASKPSAV